MKDPASFEIAPNSGYYYPTRMSEFYSRNHPLLQQFYEQDFGGVHINNMIVSHAFYLLAEGLDGALLAGALRDTLLDVASLDDAVDYGDLEESLEVFLETNGVEGLVEVFLANLIYGQVWFLVEQWVLKKSESSQDVEALRASVEGACRQLVRDAISELKDDGRLDSVGWFGAEGSAIAMSIVQGVEDRLSGAADEEG